MFLVTVIVGGFLLVRVSSSPSLIGLFSSSDAVAPPTAATVSIIFALFVAFGTSEVTQRSRELRLAVLKEISVARSVFKFSESVGASANPLRQSLIEYLQAVTTVEQKWLESNSQSSESPAQTMADTLVQVVTLFVAQSNASPSVKSLIVSKVDELRLARTERISLSIRSSGIPLWIGLTILAVVTQLIITLGYIGKRRATRAAVASFTAASVTAMCYLAWIDGLIGPSKVAIAMLPLKDLLEAVLN